MEHRNAVRKEENKPSPAERTLELRKKLFSSLCSLKDKWKSDSKPTALQCRDHGNQLRLSGARSLEIYCPFQVFPRAFAAGLEIFTVAYEFILTAEDMGELHPPGPLYVFRNPSELAQEAAAEPRPTLWLP